ncbi:MAG TPA: hypothetical protein VLC09_11980 [Polyangiaceae bacterium]|nr:hypothetical protein [Polyangiaceae bacterium]
MAWCVKGQARRVAARLGWSVVLVASLWQLGCAPAHAPASAAAPAEVPAVAPPHDWPELTEDERASRVRIDAYLGKLNGALASRDRAHPWELADTADFLVHELEAMGVEAVRQGATDGEIAIIDLSAGFAGGSRGDQRIVIASRYDTAGAEGSGSSERIALLLELARALRGAHFERSVRIALFSVDELSESRARRVFGVEGTDSADGRSGVEGVVWLGAPAGVPAAVGSASNDPIELELRAQVGAEGQTAAFEEATEGAPFQWNRMEGASESAAQLFAKLGLRVTEVRTVRPIGSEEAARLASRLRFGVARLAGETLTNDGTLTPLYPALR